MREKNTSLLKSKYRALLPEVAKIAVDEMSLTACFTLLSVADSIFEDCRKRLAEFQLSEGRFAVLLLLHQTQSKLMPSELASRAGVTRATMTGLLEGLVSIGYVKRENVDGDRRSLAISLTARGRKILERVLPLQLKWLESIFHGLANTDKRNLLRCLNIVGNNADYERRQQPRGDKKHEGQ